MKTFIKDTEARLFDKRVLRMLRMNRRSMVSFLEETGWRRHIKAFDDSSNHSAVALEKALRPVLDCFSTEPEGGWLPYIHDDILAFLYPDNFTVCRKDELRQGAVFFLEHYRVLLAHEKSERGFSPVDDIELLEDDEIEGCVSAAEYRRFRDFWENGYIFEFMRLSREITPYNTIGHIGGVHFLSVFAGRQFRGTGVPVDIALVSAAAAAHDLGKYGCRQEEARRTPYLHYYYTDDLMRRTDVPMIAHIASNHSTWDLELENLSVESLLLIYADFRVKSTRENGVETVYFYTLREAFDVILNKLDNVDEAKRHRYEKVYAKLLDFENYMHSLGIVTDPDAGTGTDYRHGRDGKDTALMMGMEVVEQIKYTAIEHNIRIMSIFNNEIAFGSLLEAARSEKLWKSQRAYLNILSEYCTYMTKKEKLHTVHFLYDLLCDREGDIRRQAGRLLGMIIADYDDVYRKELPADVTVEGREECVELWDMYLKKIVFPDYKVTDQHRSWIGYTLKEVIGGLLDKAGQGRKELFMNRYFSLFRMKKLMDSAVFVMLDSVITIPGDVFSRDDLMLVLEFAAGVSERDSVEIEIGALRVAEYASGRLHSEKSDTLIMKILGNIKLSADNLSVRHLIYKTLMNTGRKDEAETYRCIIPDSPEGRRTYEEAISAIFRENLKVGTPWVVKSVNIDFLLENAAGAETGTGIFHLASHFSNLVKVSERVTVRHRAGRGLIEIAKTLPAEQLNEIVIELMKGLEIGEYQFSKYIPEYLGEMVLYLYPGELDEFIVALSELIENTNDRIGSVALDTVGEVLKKYPSYRYRDREPDETYHARKEKLLGMLLKGLANYHEIVSQEAFMVIGQYIFGSSELTQDDKFDTFRSIYKKMLTLVTLIDEYDMTFFTNAAALNHIYRFISEYIFQHGGMELPEKRDIAFFPGTFDPFSLGHKGIVQAIMKEGFEVYLALDEFSWSKKTQPRMIRKKIMSMSIADEPEVFIFPDDFPVNIAAPSDLKRLKDAFEDKDIYIVVGSDVVANASSYKATPAENSIHTMNHIVFRRETLEGSEDRDMMEKTYAQMTGRIRELMLPMYLEDISSTRIRENIDQGRDISRLIDPVAQNFIYANSLYLREPQYKNILETKHIKIEPAGNRKSSILMDIRSEMISKGMNMSMAASYIGRPYVRTAVIRDADGMVCALAAFNELETGQLYDEFRDLETAAYFRQKATGRMVVIRGLYCRSGSDSGNLIQMILTEVLAEAVKNDVTYAIYHPLDGKLSREIIDVLGRQGFTEVKSGGRAQGIYEVSMKEPVVIIENMDTVLKDPFSKDPRVLRVLDETHADMQKALTGLYPGNLVLSFNAGIMNQKIVDMVTATNGVPNHKLEKRILGEYMCVPFSKTLRGVVIPNTVTKALHTEKMFSPTLDSFTIEEYPMYATISDQIRTIRSFNRPVILVDDLLHKGYRLRALDPVFNENGLMVRKIITGIMSGQGRDLMTVQNRDVESAYFVPNLKAWLVESTMCPFIGGDGVRSEEKTEANLIPSINLILPFAAPKFLHDADRASIYGLSKVCLENAGKIFRVIEEEYQTMFERKLTIRKLSDAIRSPRMPNGSNRVAVDFSLSPSIYMDDYLERLIRLESVLI